MRWTLSEIRVSPFSLTILLNLVLMCEIALVGVVIECRGADPEINLTPQNLPCRWPNFTFTLDEDRVARDVTVEIELSSEPDEPTRDAIVEILQVWCLVGALGGFREPVPVSTRLDLIPEDDVEVDIDLLTLVVRDNGMHEAAYDVLINLLCRVDATLSSVNHVSVR